MARGVDARHSKRAAETAETQTVAEWARPLDSSSRTARWVVAVDGIRGGVGAFPRPDLLLFLFLFSWTLLSLSDPCLPACTLVDPLREVSCLCSCILDALCASMSIVRDEGERGEE